MTLNLFDALKVISPDPFCANLPIVASDIGVLLRFSRLDVEQPDPQLLGPDLQASTEILRAIADANGQWLSSPVNDLLQRANHAFGGQGEIHFDG